MQETSISAMGCRLEAVRAGLCSLALVVFACLPTSPAQAAGEWLRFDIDGAERRVLLHAPEAPAAEAPLLVVFHGRGDDAAAFAEAVKLHEDWPEAIIAYPRGEPHEARPQRGWQYRAGQYADRDLRLTDVLLAELDTRFAVPASRRLAAGFSNGGHFVFLLMQQRPDAFAAHAVIGSVRPDLQIESAPRPMLYLFGRGEPRRYQDDWRATVESLVAHQRGSGALLDWADCCKRQAPGPGGALLVFGLYNAGHIWPAQGNDWLRAFAQEALNGGD